MSVKSQLKRWQKAGLVDEHVAGKILAYEIARQSGRFGTAMLGLGAFAIALGAIAITAANWDAIPPFLKIAFQIVVNLGLAAAVLVAIEKKWETAREVLLFLQAAAVLTFIVLIGMIYQTGAPAWQALMLWCVLTTPFLLLLARSRFTVVCWFLMVLATIGAAAEIIDMRLAPKNLEMAFFAIVPLAMLGIGQSQFMAEKRPAWSHVLITNSYRLIVVMATISQAFWSTGMSEISTRIIHGQSAIVHLSRSSAIGLSASALALGALWFFKLLGNNAQKILPMLALSIVIGFMPFFIPHGHWPVVGAAVFMIYWAAIGWTGIQLGYRSVLNLAIVLIALRLFIVYVEVFGSLLSTGFGLIISGVLVIGLVTITRKVMRKLEHAI